MTERLPPRFEHINPILRVEDPDGNVLRFGSEPEEGAS